MKVVSAIMNTSLAKIMASIKKNREHFYDESNIIEPIYQHMKNL